MLLELHANFFKIVVNLWHFVFKLGNWVGGTNTCHHVFTLSIYEVLTIKDFFTICRVTCKRYACSTGFTHVAKDHSLNINCSSPCGRNAIFLAVKSRAFILPRFEDRAYRAPKLLISVLWEGGVGALLDDRLVTLDKFFEVFGSELIIEFNPNFFTKFFKCAFKRAVIILVNRLHAHNHIAVHLNEATVAVVSKCFVARFVCKCLNGFIIESQVKNGVHHAGHGFARARANRKKKRVLLSTKFLAELLFNSRN